MRLRRLGPVFRRTVMYEAVDLLRREHGLNARSVWLDMGLWDSDRWSLEVFHGGGRVSATIERALSYPTFVTLMGHTTVGRFFFEVYPVFGPGDVCDVVAGKVRDEN